MKHIVPNLWFNDQAEEAAGFYIAAFENARVTRTDYYTDAGKEQHGHQAGQVMTVEFEIEGMRFVGINGGSVFSITPAISFFVRCSSADEVDKLWGKLSDDAKVLMPLDTYPFSKRYGWLSDKFGVSWQIILAEGEITQKIVPSLMFTQHVCGKAEEAMNFYTSILPDSAVGSIARYQASQGPDKEGSVSYGEFTLLGQQLASMDSAQAHEFTFTPGVSLLVECETQEEIDTYWQKLSALPEAEACGWLQDKYGVSWQISPAVLNDMLKQGTPEQVERVTAAFMQMKKFDIAKLQRVYDSAT